MDRESIVAALGITPEQLGEPGNLERIQQEIARGRARYRLELMDQMRLFREGKLDRGSTILLAAVRAEFGGFDEADGAKDVGAPDQAGAVAEIEQALRRLRRDDATR